MGKFQQLSYADAWQMKPGTSGLMSLLPGTDSLSESVALNGGIACSRGRRIGSRSAAHKAKGQRGRLRSDCIVTV